MADLSKVILPNGDEYNLKDTVARAMTGFYVGTCATAAGTKDKVVTLNDATGFSLTAGVVVAVKFSYSNTYSSSTSNPVTLNVNSTGAKNIWYNVTHSGAGNTGAVNIAYGTANRYIYYMYDGTYWSWVNFGNEADTNYHMPSCTTAAGTAAKDVLCTYYLVKPNSYIPIVFRYANSAASALTLNINYQGAKPLWIDGAASSSSNHTLPAGTYIVYYDGTNYYLRTDGKLTADITGDATTVNGHSVLKDVPSDAKFTDTTYESKAAVSGGTDVSLVTTGEKYLWNNAGGSGSAPEIFVGTCATAAGTKDKVVTLNDSTGFSLKPGVMVAVKFTYSNTYSSSTSSPITLNVNSTGAKNIYFNVTHSGSGNTGTAPNYYGQANKYIFYVYDGTYWVWINHGYDNDTNYHMPTCTTASATAAKAAVCSYYIPLANSYIPIAVYYDNTAASALTLNIQSQGAKPIYINGAASSSSNYTLPRGTYLVFYDGTNYYFRTDGLIQGVTAAATVNDTTLATTAYVTRAITTLDEEIAAALAQI